MLALITKASDDFYYEFKEVNTIEDIRAIYKTVIISTNYFSSDCEGRFWDGMKKTDIPLLDKAEIEIKIYDDYCE